MSLVPKKKTERVAFYHSRTATWNASAVAIGTTTAAVADLTTKVETALSKLDAALVAKNAAKTALDDADLAVAAMGHAGAAIIQQIRAKAAVGGPGVYVLAGIPAPATPSPVGPPGTPTDFRATLNCANGSLKLSWRCANPAGSVGTIYQVERRTGPTGLFVPLTNLGTRSFTDPTIPAGAASVTYRITAARTTALGVPAEFTVNFGTTASGEMTASVVAPAAADAAPKLAA